MMIIRPCMSIATATLSYSTVHKWSPLAMLEKMCPVKRLTLKYILIQLVLKYPKIKWSLVYIESDSNISIIISNDSVLGLVNHKRVQVTSPQYQSVPCMSAPKFLTSAPIHLRAPQTCIHERPKCEARAPQTLCMSAPNIIYGRPKHNQLKLMVFTGAGANILHERPKNILRGHRMCW